MAIVTSNEYDHIDVVNGSNTNRHYIKDTTARNSIENLKSEITDIADTIGNLAEVRPIVYTDGGYIRYQNVGTTVNMNPVANADFRYAVIDCAEGDYFLLNVTGGGAPRAWMFVNSSDVCVSVDTQTNHAVSNYVLKAPANASKLVLNDRSGGRSFANTTSIRKVSDYGLVGEYSATFTTTKEQKNTGIYLRAGVHYVIEQYGHPDGRLNLFISGVTTYNKAIAKDNLTVRFTPTSDGNLVAYNIDGTAVEAHIKVFYESAPAHMLEAVPKVYKVGKIPNQYDYTSFTQCLLDLKDDTSEKIIYIEAGEYDIYQEYVDAGVPVYAGSAPGQEYMDYCVWVPENTHIIGRGIVRLKWMPDPATDPITSVQTRCVSPINTAGSMTLENVEIYCKNGRYCIHDDINGDSSFSGAIKKFIGVKCYKYASDTDGSGNSYGFTGTIGFGLDRRYNITYENCEFHNETTTGYAFYGHTRGTVDGSSLTELQSSNLQIINCVIDSIRADCVKLGNSAGVAIRIRTTFAGCWFSGGIALINETSGSTAIRNAFDVALVRCNEAQITVADPNNPYPVRVY